MKWPDPSNPTWLFARDVALGGCGTPVSHQQRGSLWRLWLSWAVP